MRPISRQANSTTTRKSPEDLAARLLRDEPALRSSLDFGPFVQQGQSAGPSLLIGDQSEIPLLQHALDMRRDYRMALLAQPSDVVIVRHREEVYERYLDSYLGISDVTYLAPPDPCKDPIAVAARQDAYLSEILMKLAGGGFTLKSYITTQNTWRLAQDLGNATQRIMHLSGPSARVSKRANDKLWFTDLTRQIFDKTAVPPTMSGYTIAAAAAEIAYFAKSCDQVVAKIPDSAGSAGNVTFQSADIVGKSERALRHLLRTRLEATGWSDAFPILIGVWERDVLCSPSVQLWIPHADAGPPIAEGVFEQRTHNAEAAFIGAALSTLPSALQATLSQEAVTIATALQALGYFGRCSLDAVIHKAQDGTQEIHWIECNGRWGGVSIPMTLAKNLKGGALPDGFLVVQAGHYDFPEMTTADYLSLFNDLLFRKGQKEEGLIVTAPPTGTGSLSINLLTLCNTGHQAKLLVEEAFERLRKL
jgi:Pre ATP-grasp domain